MKTAIIILLFLVPLCARAEGLFSVPSYDGSLIWVADVEKMLRELYRDLLRPLKLGQGRVTSKFGARMHPINNIVLHHDGVDIACDVGSRVNAVLPGKVTYAGWKGGYGFLVEVEHQGEITKTRYAHLSSLAVKEGQRVAKGQLVGKSGQTGHATGPHLHFEIHQKGHAVDPMRYIGTDRYALSPE